MGTGEENSPGLTFRVLWHTTGGRVTAQNLPSYINTGETHRKQNSTKRDGAATEPFISLETSLSERTDWIESPFSSRSTLFPCRSPQRNRVLQSRIDTDPVHLGRKVRCSTPGRYRVVSLTNKKGWRAWLRWKLKNKMWRKIKIYRKQRQWHLLQTAAALK